MDTHVANFDAEVHLETYDCGLFWKITHIRVSIDSRGATPSNSPRASSRRATPRPPPVLAPRAKCYATRATHTTPSGLYYCSARYYDPATRQWTTADSAKADGEESAYQYCGGDPVGEVDPSGLFKNTTGNQQATHSDGNVTIWVEMEYHEVGPNVLAKENWGVQVTRLDTKVTRQVHGYTIGRIDLKFGMIALGHCR